MISQVFTGSFNSLMVLQGLKILTVLHCIKRLKSFCRVLQVFTRSCKLQILPQGFVSLQGLASSYKSYKVLQVVLSCCKSFKVCKVLQTIGWGVAPPCLYSFSLFKAVFAVQQVSFFFDRNFIFEREFLAISRIVRSRA